jgi:hypothetical protein
MTPIEDAIAEVLADSTDLSALVSGRIAWGDRPQGDAVPALIFRCGESADYTARGGSNGGIRSTEVELVGIAELAADAFAVVNEAYNALDDQTREVNIGTTGRKFVAVGDSRPSLLEPETGEAEGRSEVLAVLSCTLFYR